MMIWIRGQVYGKNIKTGEKMNKLLQEAPEYRSHVMRAARIMDLYGLPFSSMTTEYVYVSKSECPKYSPYLVLNYGNIFFAYPITSTWLKNNKFSPGDYLVEYSDGVQMIIEKKEFEEGYIKEPPSDLESNLLCQCCYNHIQKHNSSYCIECDMDLKTGISHN